MQVKLKFPVSTEFHTPHDPDHGSGIGPQSLRQGPHAEQDKFARAFEGGANDGLPFRAQKADAGRWTDGRGRPRDSPPLCHSAQEHVVNRRSLSNPKAWFSAAAPRAYNAG